MTSSPKTEYPPRIPQCPSRLRRSASLMMAGLCCAAMAIGVCGCFLPALGLAPLAINAVAGVGSAALAMTEGAVIEAHKGSGKSGDEDHAGESDMDREARCDQLQMDTPGLIELRKVGAGAPEYRELQLRGALDRPQWTVLADKDTNAQGWRPAVNFLHMNFTPPLGALPEAGSDYLAYALTESGPSADDRVAAMTSNFGKAEGTFDWNGQRYQYALGQRLPCFPPPPQ
jgi:hypothetical protein